MVQTAQYRRLLMIKCRKRPITQPQFEQAINMPNRHKRLYIALLNTKVITYLTVETNNNIHLYTAHITWFHGGLQFCKGEIGRQHIEGASDCRFSPFVISSHPPRPMHTKTRLQHREPRPLLFMV